MLPAEPSSDPAPPTTVLRHRAVPTRAFGRKLIVARPRDGAPVVLDLTAAFVWQLLDGWTTAGEVDRCLSHAFPDVTLEERQSAWTAILDALEADDLLERR